MSDHHDADEGVIAVMLERFEKVRLPRLLDLKARVNQGDTLSQLDIEFLKRVLSDADTVQQLAARHPEYQELMGRVFNLYRQITEQALNNERPDA